MANATTHVHTPNHGNPVAAMYTATRLFKPYATIAGARTTTTGYAPAYALPNRRWMIGTPHAIITAAPRPMIQAVWTSADRSTRHLASGSVAAESSGNSTTPTAVGARYSMSTSETAI